MKNRLIILFILFLGFFTGARFAFADVEITEIFYNPKTSSWVEIYNNTDSTIDLTQYKILDASAAVNGHGITAISGTNPIPAHTYAVIGTSAAIAKFGTVSWPLFKATLAPNTTSDTFILKLDSNVDSVSFSSSQGANGDNNSLQKINGAWIVTVPTPGVANENNNNDQSVANENNNPNNNSSSSDNTSSSSTSSTISNTPASSSSTTIIKPKITEIPKITTEILSKNIIFAGLPLKINSKTIGLNKETLAGGRYLWNFGDGMGKEEQYSKQFEYIYQYPGDYVLSLEYSEYYVGQEPEATARMIIKVLPPEMSISSVGGSSDSFVEIENKSTFEIDISKWILKGVNNIFSVPKGTIILPGKKIRFSPKITGFLFSDLSHLELMNQNAESVSVYPMLPIEKAVPTRSNISTYNTLNIPQPKIIKITPDNTFPPIPVSGVIDLNDLSANASSASRGSSNNTIAILSLIGVIVLGIGGVLYIKKINMKKTDIEGHINADDIKIIE